MRWFKILRITLSVSTNQLVSVIHERSGDFFFLREASTGYKEFSGFLSGPDHEQYSALSEATETMKANTRKYAQRQVKWIRNKLLPAARACNAGQSSNDADVKKVQVYILDTSGMCKTWKRLMS